MHSFSDLSALFDAHFNKKHFPAEPSNLYEAAQYILDLGGKRVRPICVLLANELFAELTKDAYNVATAVELFHNFSLIHDDIMDVAPLRRGKPTVHELYGQSTALLAGDVMFAQAYDNLTRIEMRYVKDIISLFNKTSKEVCEGQQLDMDFEKVKDVKIEDYILMITLKTSVLIGASLQLGGILGGAGKDNQRHLYEFGKKLGIAFQIQDDYLDAFGDPAIFGKQPGGDIVANKKTFLAIHAAEVATEAQKKILEEASTETDTVKKVAAVLAVYKDCGVDEWASGLKQKYYDEAMIQLEEVAIQSTRKKELHTLAEKLIWREV